MHVHHILTQTTVHLRRSKRSERLYTAKGGQLIRFAAKGPRLQTAESRRSTMIGLKTPTPKSCRQAALDPAGAFAALTNTVCGAVLLIMELSARGRSLSVLRKGEYSRISAPRASWIWPKTCSFGLSADRRWNRASHPTGSRSCARSRIECGGLCVRLAEVLNVGPSGEGMTYSMSAWGTLPISSMGGRQMQHVGDKIG